MEHLFNQLKKHSASEMYPYHMPGHKRHCFGELSQDSYQCDITEIEGFDNLHDATGILKVLQDQAAAMYGADESFYLVNGSTAGVLSAISSAVSEDGHILMSRNCHKSSYHAAYLRRLRVSYLYPSYIEGLPILDAITPKQVEEALEQLEDVEAVMIVSPTYEGRIADVEAISKIVHAKGIPLIVDEAHGSHLGFADGFSRNSCQCGADLVIHSVHKTLPALTQTALLHVCGALIDRDKLRRFLRIYQSSSPSYLLMGSIDNALHYVEKNRVHLFAEFRKNCHEMMEKLRDCKHLKFPIMDGGKQDIGKLVISVEGTNITGKQLYDLLRGKYHLELEMAAQQYCLAMFTVNDGKEAYERMTFALIEIDKELECLKIDAEVGAEKADMERNILESEEVCKIFLSGDVKGKSFYEAWDSPRQEVLLMDAVGMRSAEFVNLYPPGIPILVPGEQVTRKICTQIKASFECGLTVQGVSFVASSGSKPELYISVIDAE